MKRKTFKRFPLLMLIIVISAFLSSCPEGFLPDNGNGTEDNGSGDTGGNGTLTVSAPTISPSPGELTALGQIIISTLTTGASIYYTTDGTDPDANSKLYDDEQRPRLFEDTVYKAIAVKSGVQDTDFGHRILVVECAQVIESYLFVRCEFHILLRSVGPGARRAVRTPRPRSRAAARDLYFGDITLPQARRIRL